MQGEFKTDEVHMIFTAPQTTFGVTLQLMEHKGRGKGASAPMGLTPAAGADVDLTDRRSRAAATTASLTGPTCQGAGKVVLG